MYANFIVEHWKNGQWWEEEEKVKEEDSEEVERKGAVSPFEVSSKTKEPWVYIFWTKKSRICASIMHPLRVLG